MGLSHIWPSLLLTQLQVGKLLEWGNLTPRGKTKVPPSEGALLVEEDEAASRQASSNISFMPVPR